MDGQLTVQKRGLTFTIEGKQFEGVISVAVQSKAEYGVILTHGAGGSLDTGELPPLADYLSRKGFLCLRFTCRSINLKYRTKIYLNILEQLKAMSEFQLQGVFLGGRSMGSRAAVAVANSIKGTQLQTFVKGVICLAYPLIGSGKLDIRDEPLRELSHHCLFVVGDRDSMCPSENFETVGQKMHCEHDVVWLSGVGHQFVTKDEKEGEIIQTICERVWFWCCRISKMEETARDVELDNTSGSASGCLTKSSADKTKSKPQKTRKSLKHSVKKKKLSVDTRAINAPACSAVPSNEMQSFTETKRKKRKTDNP